MGAIISAIIAVPVIFVTKARDKKKAQKARKASSTPQTQPFAATQAEAVGSLQDEHLATSPPPVIGAQQEEAGVPRQRAPVLSTNTDSEPAANLITRTKEEPGSNKMASDEDYSAFLDKANQDPNEGTSKTQSSGKVGLKAVDSGVEVPAALKKVTKDAFYVSDADEPFEPVALKLKGKGLPDEDTFAKLVNHPNPKGAEVSILDIGEWDTQGQYKDLVEATREATKGSDVRVYRIIREGARVEYWVVGVSDGKLLGVKALAIES